AFLVAAVALLLLWGAWFAASRLAVYELSDSARLEVSNTVIPVQTDVAGLVMSQRLRVGDEVRQGEVLVELDAEADRRALAEERARASGLRDQLAVLEKELTSEEASLQQTLVASEAAVAEARERHKLAGINAAYAREEVDRVEKVRKNRSASELELLRARA